jgi:hypothetical protein
MQQQQQQRGGNNNNHMGARGFNPGSQFGPGGFGGRGMGMGYGDEGKSGES